MPTAVLVGRDQPAGVLRAEWARACGGRGGLVLVTGEPGVGKTSLVGAVAEDATRAGGIVVSGTCWDGQGAPDYWPWVQVVRGLERRHPDQWPAARAAAGDGLSHLLGEAGAPIPPAADGGFRLFDAVTTLLVTAARSHPVLVVLDDLQWADRASARLLEFLVRHAALEPVLVLATCRDAEVEAPDHPVRDVVLDLATKATTLSLGGLEAAAVTELVTAIAGRRPDVSLVAEIHRRTGGNPFFVEQTARLWAAGSSLATVTPGVREAVDRRVARLPAGTAAALATAALLGHDFDADVLAAAGGTTSTAAEQALAPALAERLVVPLEAGRYAFAHDLVRETLDAGVGNDERRRRYAAVVQAVTAGGPLAQRVLPAQVADFAFRAVPHVDALDAVNHLAVAARDAAGRLASEEAVGHYERALALLVGAPDPGRRRTEIELALAAEQQRAGELDAARRSYEHVLAEGRQFADDAAFARAVLGLHGLGELVGGEQTLIALVDEALARLEAVASPPSALVARLLAAASRTRVHLVGGDRGQADELSAKAVALARSAGDDAALGFCLLARHDAVWRPGTAAERASVAEEMRDVARRTADVELDLQASLLLMVARLEMGDPAGLREAASFAAAAERTRLPRQRYVALTRQGMVATLQGRLAEARRLVDEARSLADQLGEIDALSVWGDQVWELGRLEGRRDELEDLAATLHAVGDQHVVVMDAALAVDAGDAVTARRLLPEVEALGRAWPRWAELVWMTFQAELAVILGDADRLDEVRRMITPFADQWAVLGGGVCVRGPLAYWLGTVELAAGRVDEAISWFGEAKGTAERMAARPWAVLADLGLAEALHGRDEGDDRVRAAALARSVETEAGALGMAPTHERARRVAAADIAVNVFRLDGVAWTLCFGGRTAHVPDAKGLHDLHALLGRPRTDVAATALLEPAQPSFRTPGADDVLDDRAKRAYQRRLSQLDEAIDDALAAGDDHVAAKLDGERQALLDELRRAAGLGGRARRLGDEQERVRKTVTARIRDSIRRLDAVHPELAEHLRAHVSTGSSCRYDPPGEISWAL